jgi:hypothetical protein
MAKHKRMITGDCGEFYVASLLAGMGADVKIERVNAKVKDLIVTLGKRSFTVQVKTGTRHTNVARVRNPEYSYWVWRAGKKCADITDANHWYAFVFLGEWPKRGDPPKVFFVPSKYVVKTLSDKDETGGEWFWMYKTDAEECCGVAGFRKMKKAVTGRGK